MRRFYAGVILFALLASAVVVTANASYPVASVSNPRSNVPARASQTWPGTGFRHPKAKLPYSGLRAFDGGPGLSSNTSPSWGTDIQVSTDNPGRPHNQMTIASNPLNPLNFISGANDYGLSGLTGYYYTTNGGLSWAGGNFQPPYPGGTGIAPGGDSSVDFDAAGTAIFGDLGYDTDQGCTGGVYVHKSTNGGASWGSPVQVTANTLTRIFNDKDWLAADRTATSPYANRLYVAYTKFDAGPGQQFCTSAYLNSPIELRYSSNGGATFSAEVAVGPQS